MAAITTWIGESGRPYPAIVTPISEFAAKRSSERLVALAVHRSTTGLKGIARPIGAPVDRITSAWLSKARASGAIEIHTIEPDADPQAVIEDLRGQG